LTPPRLYEDAIDHDPTARIVSSGALAISSGDKTGRSPADKHQIKVRIICSRAYHALFMHNMLIRIPRHKLDAFGDPDFTIMNVPVCRRRFSCRGGPGTTSLHTIKQPASSQIASCKTSQNTMAMLLGKC
jgi:ATP-dependent phosphoenolpyruvate carboxykinase